MPLFLRGVLFSAYCCAAAAAASPFRRLTSPPTHGRAVSTRRWSPIRRSPRPRRPVAFAAPRGGGGWTLGVGGDDGGMPDGDSCVYNLGTGSEEACEADRTTCDEDVNDGAGGRSTEQRQPDERSTVLDTSWISPDTNKNRRTRRRRHRGEKSDRRLTSSRCPTTIVGRGGAMEPPPSSNSHSRAIQQLAKRYDAELPPLTENQQLPQKYQQTILLSSRTSLAEALDLANADARFLVCYIAKRHCPQNAVAVPALLAPEVVKAANRRPLGKSQADAAPRSHYVWITDDDDDRAAAAALRRLRARPPPPRGAGAKGTAPVLVVVHPAAVRHPTTGQLRVAPRIVAQHHCQPPPASPAGLVAWLATLRRRHRRDYARLQHERRERRLHQERTEGYRGSVEEDGARARREVEERARREEEEEEARRRAARVEARRGRLRAALAPEPAAGAEGSVTIALRFAARGSGDREGPLQRRFDKGTTRMNDVFDWVDAVHGLERETVELSTMNGAKKFVYVGAEEDEEKGGDSMTLEEAGLGKMVALRVTEIVEAKDGEGAFEEEENEEEESEKD